MYKWAPKCGSLCKGSCRGIVQRKLALMAQHSVGATLSMVGSLPSRALGMMVFIGQHLATPDVVDELFATCLRTSNALTSAVRKNMSSAEPQS